MGHVLEHIAIELQVLVGTPVTFGKTRGEGLPKGQYHVVYSYVEEEVGLAAWDLAMRLVRHLLPPERADHDPSPFDFEAEFEALVRIVQRHAFGPSTAALVKAAEARDIPWIRLNEGSLVQLGYGKHQKRIQATVTSETRQIASEIASDKRLTQRILEQLGLPVPRQAIVYDADEAVEEAGAARLPGGGQAARRQPRHGGGDQPQVRRPGARGLRQGAGAWEPGDRRGLPAGQRLPHPGGRRPRRRRRPAGPRPRDGGRPADDRRADRGGQPRSPARHRPREDAHPPGGRRPGAAAAGGGGADARLGAAGRRDLLPAHHRQPLDRRHGDRPHRRASTRRTGRWPSARSRRSASTSAASTSSRPTSPAATGRWGAPSSRSTPRPASACTWRPPRGSRATSPVR